MAKKRKKGAYQTGRTTKSKDRRIKAKGPGKRASKGGSVYYERRKNRSDMPGSLLGVVTMKRMPKRPKASAPTSIWEKHLKKAKVVNEENAKRIRIAKQVKELTGKKKSKK
jgi:hypothetical protein